MEKAKVRGAKTNRTLEVLSDSYALQADAKARPGDASLDAVRAATADALDELAGYYESVEDVNDVALPSDRLAD